MNAPPAAHGLSQNDESELSTLSILFYAYGGLVGVTAIALALAAILPALLMANAPPQVQQGGWFIGGAFIAIFGALALILLAKSALMIVAGRAIAGRTRYVLCMIGACACLMNIPLGTALGIYTLMVLQRPAVKARFSHLS